MLLKIAFYLQTDDRGPTQTDNRLAVFSVENSFFLISAKNSKFTF